ncbi:Ribosomal protein S18 acetylase RimI [Devosia lucknowensis]|uniref:Ribosomal protein S18 acetylase RimI n=1 Tax=Devosia lucknowensis TaxID=1096929 RepID=A0A1Y6FBV5_9HYPH|nr:GNAT family N-acetyltransferase [Devosia lucknowensis]SMQ70262.1 Ribosomal protein S18 acetylase RimI [Devosia lucknowensis]
MTSLLFRDATPADIPVMVQLSHAGDARGSETPPLDAATLADPRYRAAFDAIAADPGERLIVAEVGGEIVGTLQISIIPGLPRFGTSRAMLENVHIRADQRGNGLGSEMVMWAVEEARKAGCGIVQLTSNKVRLDAHRFYQKLGFEATHEGFKLYL